MGESPGCGYVGSRRGMARGKEQEFKEAEARCCHHAEVIG